MTKTVLPSIALFLCACGGPSDLGVHAVQGIPDGDASGAASSGRYSVEIRTIECSGSCGPFSLGIFSTSVCDVGDVEEDTIEVTQTDGHLQIDTGELPSRFEGGAFSDGSFDVGGYATQFGGELQITARGTGRVDSEGRLDATIRSRTFGDIEGQGADCYGVREVNGVRD